MKERVAIIGTGASRSNAPWGVPVWDFWALNGIKATGWIDGIAACGFEIHPWSILSDRERSACRRAPFPVYMRCAYPYVPKSVRYPIERIRPGPLTCTFCYQIALAIAQGVREIGLWGVDLDKGTARERTVEWWGVTYWLGVADGAGIRVTLAPRSRLLRYRFRYGLDYWSEVRDVRRKLSELSDTLKGPWDGFGGRRAHVTTEALKSLNKRTIHG